MLWHDTTIYTFIVSRWQRAQVQSRMRKVYRPNECDWLRKINSLISAAVTTHRQTKGVHLSHSRECNYFRMVRHLYLSPPGAGTGFIIIIIDQM